LVSEIRNFVVSASVIEGDSDNRCDLFQQLQLLCGKAMILSPGQAKDTKWPLPVLQRYTDQRPDTSFQTSPGYARVYRSQVGVLKEFSFPRMKSQRRNALALGHAHIGHGHLAICESVHCANPHLLCVRFVK